MIDNLFVFLGAAGTVLVAFGVIVKSRTTEHVLYILGGLCLEIYSIAIHNIIFIVLQIVFMLSALYDLGFSLKTKDENKVKKD